MIRAFPLTIAMLAILVLATAFRLPRLDQRPMHADEANQAVKAGRLYEKGVYDYDTTDHHGPTLYWLTLPALWISGAPDLAQSQVLAYRIVPVVFGIGLIPLLLLFIDGIGWPAVLGAAVLTAISPALVFYSRYYIQETLLVFFTLAALGFGWRYVRTRRLGWIIAAGAAVGMMHATKETWILAAAAAVGAAVLTYVWSQLQEPISQTSSETNLDLSPGQASGQVPQGRNGPESSSSSKVRLALHFLAAALTAGLVAAAFFSMFGKHWRGPLDSIVAYANYFRRGKEQGIHAEPWYYYLQLLFAFRPSRRILWSEGLIAVLALAGGMHSLAAIFPAYSAWRGKRNTETIGSSETPTTSTTLLCFLTFYSFLLALIYSRIPYKTPWCALSFLMGMILLAGVGMAAILRLLPNRSLKVVAAVLLTAGAGHLGWQAYQLNFNPAFLADPRNPYVYAHTPTPLPKLGARLDRLAERVPDGRDLWIQVVVPENYWPLPWYFRKFNENRVCYWLDATLWRRAIDHFPKPAILILSCDVDSKNLENYLAAYGGPVYESLRPGVLVAVYVRKDLWPIFLECQ